jgi:hypothetical protein
MIAYGPRPVFCALCFSRTYCAILFTCPIYILPALFVYPPIFQLFPFRADKDVLCSVPKLLRATAWGQILFLAE